MIAFPVPRVDAALVVAMVVSFCGMLAAALAVRPELRNGKKLDRMPSYIMGTVVLLGSIMLLALYRGLACDCWYIYVPQLWLDAALLSASCGAATAAHRIAYGEPRRGSPHTALATYQKEAQNLTDAILDSEND